jgi:type IV pilus assembly protein PilW
MNARTSANARKDRGVGLVEIMVSIVIGMLLVLMIFQIYLVTEGQKRTITGSNDAQENAGYGLFLIGQELSVAGNIISASTTALSGCAMLRPIPVVIAAGATATDPDTITVLYGGSGSLSSPTSLLNSPAMNTSPPGAFQVSGPVAYSPNDLIAVVQGANCTLSTINAGGVTVAGSSGIATLAHTLTATPGNNSTAVYGATLAQLINLGQGDRIARTLYSVDTANTTLRSQSLLPTAGATNNVASNVVNLKAQFGLDTDNDGDVDTWQAATGTWSSANLPLQAATAWQQIKAVRVAIVTRSEKRETDVVTAGPLGMFCSPSPCALSMALTTDQQHYRYRVMETIVPLRNAVWNAP